LRAAQDARQRQKVGFVMLRAMRSLGATSVNRRKAAGKAFETLDMLKQVAACAEWVTVTVLGTALIVMVTLSAFGQAGAIDMPGADSGWEEKVRTFLQKRFKIPEGSQISFGPLQASVFPGLFSRSVTITNDQGASAKFSLFTDGKSSKFVIGEVLNSDDEPWGRVNVSGLHLEDRATMGPVNAPVTIIEFADFECPFCARSFSLVESVARNRYHNQVRLIFKNFPLRGHTWARGAAVAAECVRLQNPEAFWPFASNIYASQPQINDSNLRQYVEQFSNQLKLDSAALDACAMSSAPEKTIDQDIRDGIALRVSSTPTLFVNGVPLIGVPDEKTLDFVIASELHPKTAGSQ
jgi:protein-disulfide isomerase